VKDGSLDRYGHPPRQRTPNRRTPRQLATGREQRRIETTSWVSNLAGGNSRGSCARAVSRAINEHIGIDSNERREQSTDALEGAIAAGAFAARRLEVRRLAGPARA
jgi:hypothetical protein